MQTGMGKLLLKRNLVTVPVMRNLMRNLGTLVTSVTVTNIKMCL